MAKKKPSNQKRLEGKSVLLADDMIGWDPSDATLLIEEHGGRIVDVMGPDVDVVVVPRPDEGPPSRTERQAKSLNARGADIRILSEWELQQLVGPTRDEALRLLRGSRSDLARFQRYCDLLPYLHVADLSDSDLSDVPSRLNRVVIDRCDLRGGKLIRSDILSAKDANFDKTTLSDTKIRDCDGASFDRAILRNVRVGNAEGCTFRKATFRGRSGIRSAPRANFDRATGIVSIGHFSKGSARGVTGRLLFGVDPVLTEADLSNGVLLAFRAFHASAFGIRLVETSAKRSDMRGAQMESSDFTDARFPGLSGSYGNFRKARLVRTQLNKAVLFRADLREADLTGANLMGANLKEADFRGATLTDADLTGANTSGAKFDS